MLDRRRISSEQFKNIRGIIRKLSSRGARCCIRRRRPPSYRRRGTRGCVFPNRVSSPFRPPSPPGGSIPSRDAYAPPRAEGRDAASACVRARTRGTARTTRRVRPRLGIPRCLLPFFIFPSFSFASFEKLGRPTGRATDVPVE